MSRDRALLGFDPGGGAFLSAAGSGMGQHERRCPGCRDHPHEACAGCGAPAVRAVVDPDFPCAVTYCAACFTHLIAARAYFASRRLPAETRAMMSQMARARHAKRRAAELAREEVPA